MNRIRQALIDAGATIGTVLLLLIAAAAPAAPPDSQWFGSELEAVVSATRQYNPQSIREDREFMGAILRHDDCYTFTVGAGQPGRDRIAVRIAVPAGAEIVAFWHTHGARHPSHRYFSDVDTALVGLVAEALLSRGLHRCTLKVIAPGMPTLSRHRARRLGLPARTGYARGDAGHRCQRHADSRRHPAPGGLIRTARRNRRARLIA